MTLTNDVVGVFNCLMVISGLSMALITNSLYGMGIEATSTRNGAVMYSATSLFAGLGGLASAYAAC